MRINGIIQCDATGRTMCVFVVRHNSLIPPENYIENKIYLIFVFMCYTTVCVLAQASTTKLKSALHAFDSSIVTKANLLRAKTHSSRDGFLFTHFTLAHTDTTHIPTQVNVSLILCFFYGW